MQIENVFHFIPYILCSSVSVLFYLMDLKKLKDK